MARPFFQATAEQVVLVSEAIASLDQANPIHVGAFTDLPAETAESALKLAEDLGLLGEGDGSFFPATPLCKLLRTPHEQEKAAILRVFLESYEPFTVFRDEYDATQNVSDAANRTKTKLDFDCHREKIKETLLNLATYTGALTAGQGNSYTRDVRGITAILDEIAAGSREFAEASSTIREELGAVAEQVSQANVIQPLAVALRHAAAGAGREAVLQAGIAVENFLTEQGVSLDVDLNGANGVNAKVERLFQAGHYPSKIRNLSKYIGHIRNAADHGVDDEIEAPWTISPQTGRNYVFVAAKMIKAMVDHSAGVHEL